MLKEKAKTTVIFLFILNALFLTGKIWFNEKLWSSDYNFFVFESPKAIISRFFEKEEYSMPKESLSHPKKIVVNSGNEMTVYYNSDPSFSPISDALKEMLVPVLSSQNTVATDTDMEEWYTALYGASLYAEYSLDYPPELFAQILGVREAGAINSLSLIKDYIIAPDGEGGADLYIRDAERDKVKKIHFTPRSQQAFSFLNESPAADELYFFAFDLGLSVADSGENQPTQSVLLSPMILISANEITASRVQSSNPMISAEGSLDDEIVGRILAPFHCSARTSRHYTDASGTQVYVENTGTLKLYDDGMIEYAALSPDRGIRVMDEPSGSLYTNLNSAIDFLESVWEGALPEESLNVCVSGDLAASRMDDTTFRFTFDYYVAGNPVQTALSAADGHEPMSNAVEVVISGGSIISYRHLVRQFRTEGTAEVLPMIDALNEILAKGVENTDASVISDMFLSYVEDGSGRALLPEWCVRFRNSDEILRYGGEASE